MNRAEAVDGNQKFPVSVGFRADELIRASKGAAGDLFQSSVFVRFHPCKRVSLKVVGSGMGRTGMGG